MRLNRLFQPLLLLIATDLFFTSTAAGFDVNGDLQQEWRYTIRPDETIKQISDRFLSPTHEWHEIVLHNNLQSPHYVKPGTVIRIPVDWLRNYPKPAKIIQTEGQVLLRRAHSTAYVSGKRNYLLRVGDELKTKNGAASIRFADGSSIKMEADSVIIFNTLTHYGKTGMVDTRLRFIKGGLENVVTPRQFPAGRYEVSTPSAVAAVRGTEFRLRATDNQTSVEVISGELSFSNTTGHQRLYSGQGAVASEYASFRPQNLLPAPDVQFPKIISDFPQKATWRELKSAEAYVVNLSGANTTSGIVGRSLLDTRTTQATVDLPVLAQGDYRLTIRGVDSQGMEGMNTVINFIVAPKTPLKPDSSDSEESSPSDDAANPDSGLNSLPSDLPSLSRLIGAPIFGLAKYFIFLQHNLQHNN